MQGSRRTLAALCVAALALGACSGDDSEGGDATEASTPAASTATSGTPSPATSVATDTSTPTDGATDAPASTGPPATTVGPQPHPTSAPDLENADVHLGDSIVDVPDPTTLAVRPGDDTFYFTGRTGMVWGWTPGSELREVLDMRALTEGSGEQGLLGLAFSSDGTKAYVDYTGADDGGNTHVDEYAVGADGTFDPATRRELLEVDQPFSNHNGGQLAIGPDGMLYIGLGDGGDAGDPDRRSLDLDDLLGKILRIDPAGDPYTVPSDNPFVGQDGARPEIWSYGLRNPWRFSFDPDTGDLWIGDVGQGEWEEIDLAVAASGRDAGKGLNFGWSAFEGTHPYNDDQPTDGVTPPFYEYSHNDGCSVSGGEVYRGSAIAALAGWYVFADYCSGVVWGLQITLDDTGNPVLGGQKRLGDSADVSAVEVGPDGELYVLSFSEGIRPLLPA
jgi:glucose/arabinose dehydrogenase